MKPNIIKIIIIVNVLMGATPNYGQSPISLKGTLLTENLTSSVLKENRIGLNPERAVKVYLPPGYSSSKKSYPVVYYLHNTFYNPDKLVEDGKMIDLLERGLSNGTVREFILVAADYSSPTTGSIYENSPVSGKWLDFTVKELVPFIDRKFRTLATRESRAVTGDFFGGRGALKLAMTHADVFSVVYALHPVATGTGPLPWPYIDIDWKKTHEAKSFDDIRKADGRTQLFLAFSQAYLPNLNRPPLFCDFYTEEENGVLKYLPEKILKIKKGFLLDETLNECADNLRTMRGIAFDWGRFDNTYAHVYSNQEFSRKLQDLGIGHEAEEYSGNPWDRTWTDHGRFYSRVLPFLNRHLLFDTNQ